MKLLLDTATVLWIASDDSKLSIAAKQAYEDSANIAYVSVISIWEILLKNRLGKLPLPMPIEELLRPMRTGGGVEMLALKESAVFQLTILPDLHRDPFDRMLVCQAIDEDLVIVTPDQLVRDYPVRSVW